MLRQSSRLHLQVRGGVLVRAWCLLSPSPSAHCSSSRCGPDVDACCRQRRPSCYNCGEGGHTADECRRERPPLVRNEQQPALSQSAWDYGRGYGGGGADDHRGSRGYDSSNAARCAVSRRANRQLVSRHGSAAVPAESRAHVG